MRTCNITLAGLKDNSVGTSWACLVSQSKSVSTSDSFAWKLSQFLTALSKSTLIEYGNLSIQKLFILVITRILY